MRLLAGIGCRTGVAAADVTAALAAALAAAGRTGGEVAGLATIARKAQEPGLVAAAAALGLPVLAVPGRGQATVTESAASRSATGLGSVAEAAALDAAGPGARLLGPRRIAGGATCALAEARP